MILCSTGTLLLAAYDLIVEKSVAPGGVCSGEHGTGKRKRGDFLKCYGGCAAEQILATKRALDPGMILNTGNVVMVAGDRMHRIT